MPDHLLGEVPLTIHSAPELLARHFRWQETAPLHTPRWMPSTHFQFYASVLTLWNLLDRNVEAHLGRAGTPFGYMRPVQLAAYATLAAARENQTYCEIGFNGGHGAAVMLLASRSLRVHSFELGVNGPYTESAARLLMLYFGARRFRMHAGNSLKTVPDFGRVHGPVCDILLVDGDHSERGAYYDIVNMRQLAKPGSTLLVDDLDGGAGRALRRAESEFRVAIDSWNVYNATALENPCVRRVRLPMLFCPRRWGWARAHFVE